MTTRPAVQLGDKAKHAITGFTGVVVCISNWISGCQRITIQSQELRDGKPVDNQSFDAEEIEVIQPDAIPVCKPSGGPCPEPTRNSP